MVEKSLKNIIFFFVRKNVFPKNIFLNVHNMLFSMYFVAKIHHFGADFSKNI
jgi:hypothetical protein